MKKYILVMAGALLLFSACATGGSSGSSSGGKRPAWIEDKHSAYPEDKFLVELGEGSSLKKAKSDALASLTQIFRTTVKVDSTVRTRYQELSDGKSTGVATQETTVDENITQLSGETLINVNFGESWTDNLGRTYVVAYIDRVKTAMIYRQRIQADADRTDYFIKESAKQSDLLRRFGYLDSAVVMDTNSQMMLDQLDIIHSPSRRSIMLSYSPEELYTLYSDTAAEMVFTINVEGDSEGNISSSVSQVLTGRGFGISDSAGDLAVTGRVSMEDANLDNGYENIRWTLFMEMRNEAGDVVVTMDENKRETGISREAAVSRGYRSMEDMLQKKFIGDLERYFDSFAGQ